MKTKSAPVLFLVGTTSVMLWAAAHAAPPDKPAAPAPAAKAPEPKGAAPAAKAERAEILAPKEPLGEATALEVRFPSAMVPANKTGQAVDAATVLDIKPPVPGVFRWQSTRSGTFEPEGVVPLGNGYKVGLKKGLRNAAGGLVEAPVVTAESPKFALREFSPRYFTPATETSRQPEITLLFNDAVKAEAVAKDGRFVNKAGATIAVSARTPLLGELGKNPGITGTWEQQAEEEREGDLEAPAVSVVRVKPLTPLPVGENWTFKLPPSLANESGTARTISPIEVVYGTITPMGVNNLEAEPVLDAPRQLRLSFNKKCRI